MDTGLAADAAHPFIGAGGRVAGLASGRALGAGRYAQAVIDKLNKAVADALNSPEGKKRLAEQGLAPESNSPAQASQFVAAEMQQWGAVVKAAGIKAD